MGVDKRWVREGEVLHRERCNKEEHDVCTSVPQCMRKVFTSEKGRRGGGGGRR